MVENESLLKPIDWNNLEVGEEIEIDPKEDAWEFASPIKPDTYLVRLFTAKDTPERPAYCRAIWEDTQTHKKTLYYKVFLEAKVISDNPDLNNTSIVNAMFGPLSVTTLPGRKKRTCTMAGAIQKMGYKVPDKITPDKLVKMFKAAMAKEPVVKFTLDWKAGYMGKEKDKTGKEVNKWVNAANTYTDFPLSNPNDPNSDRLHQMSVTMPDGGKQTVNAQVFVRKWYGKNEVVEEKVVSQPKPGTDNGLLVEDEEGPTPVKGTGTSAPASPKVEDEDLLLMQ